MLSRFIHFSPAEEETINYQLTTFLASQDDEIVGSKLLPNKSPKSVCLITSFYGTEGIPRLNKLKRSHWYIGLEEAEAFLIFFEKDSVTVIRLNQNVPAYPAAYNHLFDKQKKPRPTASICADVGSARIRKFGSSSNPIIYLEGG